MKQDNLISTITALATPVGQGSVGIVRLSGPSSLSIAKKMLGFEPKPRYAHYTDFLRNDGSVIDKGIALFFNGPDSFTGEDIIEFQGHGGATIMYEILNETVSLGAELAEPGEFSKRAFLNGKIDLVQAEAISDLIDANSKIAADSAMKSLKGEFSRRINNLNKKVIDLRVFLEATIDFSDEEIDFIEENQVSSKIKSIHAEILSIYQASQSGSVLREGFSIAIVGKPNAGKSSLLNALTEENSAIVTDIAGTTRDLVRESIIVNGNIINIIDTAGLHETDDFVEKEGIKRARDATEKVDLVIFVFDARDVSPDRNLLKLQDMTKPIIYVKNKVDLTQEDIGIKTIEDDAYISISAKNLAGIDILLNTLITHIENKSSLEGVYLARKRHIEALNKTMSSIENAGNQLEMGSIELVAEDLRSASQYLSQITGEFSSDDLLGEIFSSFCIGK